MAFSFAPCTFLPAVVSPRSQSSSEVCWGVFDLAVEAICAHPEVGTLPRHTGLINSDKPKIQQEVRSDALPSATHRDAEQMTPELIHARLMWKLRSLLEGNIAARQASTPPIAREKPLSNQLPVPMQSFCESEDTWWKLLREIVNWMSTTFVGKLRFSPDSDTAEAFAIRAAVRQYRQQHGIVGDRQYGGHASRSDEGQDGQAVEDESQSAAPETPTARRASEEDVPQCSPS